MGRRKQRPERAHPTPDAAHPAPDAPHPAPDAPQPVPARQLTPAPALRPTPRALGGRRDPATRVRPVDYTAVPRRAAQGTPDNAATGSGSASANTPGATEAGADTPGATATAERAEGPSARLPNRPRPGPRPEPRARARTVELPRPAPSPPAAAVHTLDASDPRPVRRPLQVREELIRTIGPTVLELEQIVLTVADPADAWTADAGTSDHFLRGDLVVQVRRADNAVIGVFPTRYALAVRPTEYEPALDVAEDAAGPSARGGRGTRHPTTRRELMARMQQAGFVIAPGSTHQRVSHPEHPGLFVPLASTPSDRRYTRHAVTQIRRVFGIDLRR